MLARNVLLAAVSCSLASLPCAAAQAASGPLDPLTAEEIATAFRVIERSTELPATAFFPIVDLGSEYGSRRRH
jgi:Cu2+-containing amine oxidase